MASSELIDHIHHEHDHLTRLFEDVSSTFEKLQRGELEGDDRTEALQSASDDLRLALDEMMQHFAEEEEVLFVEIESQFPDMAPEIARLTETHEVICRDTRWLQTLLSQQPRAIEQQVARAIEVLQNLHLEVRDHSAAETKVYSEALGKLPPDRRRRMLEALNSI